jgi:hypothetical protein
MQAQYAQSPYLHVEIQRVEYRTLDLTRSRFCAESWLFLYAKIHAQSQAHFFGLNVDPGTCYE